MSLKAVFTICSKHKQIGTFFLNGDSFCITITSLEYTALKVEERSKFICNKEFLKKLPME